MTVYTCSPDLASILTCIYEAWNSRLGYRNVRLMTEPVGNLELFCDYCHVEPDTEKAASVTRSIQKKIGAAAWRLVYLCAMSERSDAPDVIYRFLLYGFCKYFLRFSDPGLAYFPESQCADPGRSPFF